ncbi:MAG: efflux RND transporter periplasmic adaptor subunit [Halioglobus sp.]|nr:efflux RND transporter periplasmic adaptor subunit [Halioglobus sp.]
MNKKSLFTILVLMGGFSIALLISVNKQEVTAQPYKQLIPSIRVVRVQPAKEYLIINSQGTVQPRNQSELIPEVTGRVTYMSAAMVNGGAFEKDEVLVRIDEADYLTLLQRSKAAVMRSEAEHELSKNEFKRVLSLHKRQLASQQQLDDARRAQQVDEALLIEARASLEQADRDLSRTKLRAPFDGLVRSERVNVGQFITRGESIGTIYGTDYVEVRLPISVDQLGFLGLPVSTRGIIAPKQRPPVTLIADFGDTRTLWEGHLVRLEAEFDESSRMVYGVVRLQLDDDGASPLLPVGLFVQAEIRGRQVDQVIRLPRSAMRDNNQVLVVGSDDRIHFRQVSLVRQEHDDILISDGLEGGELVSISAMQAAVDGMLVKPVIQ